MPKAKLVQMKRTSPEVAENRLEETSVEQGATSKKSKRGRPFERGNQFGKGRPKGSPNKKSLELQDLLLENGEDIILKLIDLADKGDRMATTLVVERLIPRLKDAPEIGVEKQEEEQITIEVQFV